MAKEITENELILALQQALVDQPEDSGALTSRELAIRLAISQKTVLVRLRNLKDKGLLEAVRVVREDLGGRMQRVVAYRLKEEME